MYVYDMQVSMSDPLFLFDDVLISAIQEAIQIANASFSAVRYNRTIEYVKKIDERSLHLRMCSRDPINATRSLSSLSRALVRNEREKGSALLDGHIQNGCVFSTKLMEESTSHISALPDSEIVQEIISIFFGQAELNNREKRVARETAEKIRTLVIAYANKKKEI